VVVGFVDFSLDFFTWKREGTCVFVSLKCASTCFVCVCRGVGGGYVGGYCVHECVCKNSTCIS
jgi:hypothetical protein